eukprot:GHVP01016233.1.p1 GENE.GHVP01016233.1~~GHVP01016233.1.p1  ORF type:complete len:128 (-),score=8.18 GHVP01016233.1:167-550(-)
MPYTAFITTMGQFEFTVLPFGIRNSPACMQQTMDLVFKDLVGQNIKIYIDDFVLATNTLDEHRKLLIKIFTRIREARLFLQLKKCEFFKSEVVFLGHQVCKDGILPSPTKIQSLIKIRSPSFSAICP